MANFSPVEININDLPKVILVTIPEGSGTLNEVIQSLKSDIIYSTKYLLEESEKIPDIKITAKHMELDQYQFTIESVA